MKDIIEIIRKKEEDGNFNAFDIYNFIDGYISCLYDNNLSSITEYLNNRTIAFNNFMKKQRIERYESRKNARKNN